MNNIINYLFLITLLHAPAQEMLDSQNLSEAMIDPGIPRMLSVYYIQGLKRTARIAELQKTEALTKTNAIEDIQISDTRIKAQLLFIIAKIWENVAKTWKDYRILLKELIMTKQSNSLLYNEIQSSLYDEANVSIVLDIKAVMHNIQRALENQAKTLDKRVKLLEKIRPLECACSEMEMYKRHKDIAAVHQAMAALYQETAKMTQISEDKLNILSSITRALVDRVRSLHYAYANSKEQALALQEASIAYQSEAEITQNIEKKADLLSRSARALKDRSIVLCDPKVSPEERLSVYQVAAAAYQEAAEITQNIEGKASLLEDAAFLLGHVEYVLSLTNPSSKALAAARQATANAYEVSADAFNSAADSTEDQEMKERLEKNAQSVKERAARAK